MAIRAGGQDKTSAHPACTFSMRFDGIGFEAAAVFRFFVNIEVLQTSLSGSARCNATVKLP